MLCLIRCTFDHMDDHISVRDLLFLFQLYQEVKLRRESNTSISENKPIHNNKAEQQSCSPILEWSDPPGLYSCSPDKESLQSKAEKESKCVKNKRRNRVFAKDHLTFENSKESEDCVDLKTTKNYTQDLNIVSKCSELSH